MIILIIPQYISIKGKFTVIEQSFCAFLRKSLGLMGFITIIYAPVPTRSSAGGSLKVCAWNYLFPSSEKEKIPSGEIFKPPGLRLNGQELAGKEKSKPAKSLKAFRGSGGER